MHEGLKLMFQDMEHWDDDKIIKGAVGMMKKIVPDWRDPTDEPNFSELPDDAVTGLGMFLALSTMPLFAGAYDPRIVIDGEGFVVPRPTIRLAIRKLDEGNVLVRQGVIGATRANIKNALERVSNG